MWEPPNAERGQSAHSSSGAVASALAALLAVTILVRVLDPTGWLGSDDAAYHSAAEHVLTGTPIERLHHHYARMAVVAPVAASIAIFGNNAFAVALPSVVASVVCVLLVVLLGRRLWGWWEGLLAGTVVAVLPYFRVLSTVAYPDVHVCLWTTAAMLLAISASQDETAWGRAAARWCLAGAAFALAVSAKVFAVAVLAGVVCIVAQRARFAGRPQRATLLPSSRPEEERGSSVLRTEWEKESRDQGLKPLATIVRHPGGRRDDTPPATMARQSGGKPRILAPVAMFCFGAAVVQVADGLFYWRAAGDFFFSLRATLSASENVANLAGETSQHVTAWTMAWERLTIFLHPSVSGWGLIGIFFWPALIVASVLDRRGRILAAWALAVFVLVAFVPVGFKGGVRAYPIFHGRHILPACIPFALCLAWCVCRLGEAALRATWHRPAWVSAAAAIVALSCVDTRALNGFRDRATSRVGQAVAGAARSIPDDGRDIFITPSMYWRFRVLFPPELRSRLRVAAAEGAADWWRRVCPDIADRERPLPPPGTAYLLATPRQLRGEAEQWDYGVPLPPDLLPAWRKSAELACFIRDSDKSIRPLCDSARPVETVLLLHGAPAGSQAVANAEEAVPQASPPTDR